MTDKAFFTMNTSTMKHTKAAVSETPIQHQLDWMSAIYTEQGLHMTELSAQFTPVPSPRKDNADSIVLRTIGRVMT
jgi:hypothetical protein